MTQQDTRPRTRRSPLREAQGRADGARALFYALAAPTMDDCLEVARGYAGDYSDLVDLGERPDLTLHR